MTVVFASLTILAAIAVLPFAVWQGSVARRTLKRDGLKATIDELTRDQGGLNELALSDSKISWRALPDLPVLTKREWMFEHPVPIQKIKVEWSSNNVDDGVGMAKSRARRMLPRPFTDYTTALKEVFPILMQQIYNGYVYRPVDIRTNGDHMTLGFIDGHYFDSLDTSEVLAFETQLVRQGNRVRSRYSYRTWLEDPFNLRKRSTSLGIITLTVRKSDRCVGFYMHHRKGNHVVLGPELIHTVPAGEFTPSNVGNESRSEDFDLWMNIQREYAEEFLNTPESYGQGGATINFGHQSPYRELSDGFAKGIVRVFAFGIVFDPLTWKPELLTTCVIDSELFDEVFADLVADGREGVIITGRNNFGVPFTEENILRYQEDPITRPAAAACLALAWRYRDSLGISNP